jgi:hypothetical protein
LWVDYSGTYGIHCHVDAAYGGCFIQTKDNGELSRKAPGPLNHFIWLIQLRSTLIRRDMHPLRQEFPFFGIQPIQQWLTSFVLSLILLHPSSSIWTIQGSRSVS